MKIAVLGAGVIGITSAYFLNKRGHDVVVIDREPSPSRACSFANGGQLSYCYHPICPSPAVVKMSLKWLGKKDAPLLFRLHPDRMLFSWLWRFMTQATWTQARKNLETSLLLGLYSREVMHQIIEEEELDFHYTQNGHIHVFNTEEERDKMAQLEAFKGDYGAGYKMLSAEECKDLEPAIDDSKLAGGLLNELDEGGDIYAFTVQLAEICKQRGVQFMYDTEITGFDVRGDRLEAVHTSAGDVETDAYVLSLGSQSGVLAKQMGIKLPIYPLKGYSVTIPAVGEHGPSHSLTDQSNKIVFTRFGDDLRVAGTAEFAGHDTSVVPHRIEMLKEMILRRYPNVPNMDKATEWACLRPATPDGPPVIGKCKLSNLLMNTGHGTLGWTQAAASAVTLADIIDGKDPKLYMEHLVIDRF